MSESECERGSKGEKEGENKGEMIEAEYEGVGGM